MKIVAGPYGDAVDKIVEKTGGMKL